MKLAAQIFIGIGMVLGCLAIFPLVIGIFAQKKIDEAKSAHELQVLGIITLLFCSLFGGIFMLLIKDEDLSGEKAQRENLLMVNNNAEVEEFDDHQIHITEHIRALLTEDYSNNLKAKQRVVSHLKKHKLIFGNQSVEVAQ